MTEPGGVEEGVAQPEWLMEIRDTYRIARQAKDRAEEELGNTFRKTGSIDREESERVRNAFYDFMGQTAGGFPETVLLEQRGGRVFDMDYGGGISTTEIVSAYKHFYLPRTNERLTYYPGRDPGRDRNGELDPTGPNFIGVDKLRDIKTSAILITKSLDNVAGGGLLTDNEIDQILAKGEEVLKEPGDLETFQVVQQKIVQINQERVERKLKAKEKHGEVLARLVGNLSEVVGEHFGIRLPNRIPLKEDRVYDQIQEKSIPQAAYFYYPREKRLTSAPVNKRTGFLGRERFQVDWQNQRDLDVTSWPDLAGYVMSGLTDMMSRSQASFVMDF